MRGVERMVDEDRYCIDILTQVAAAAKSEELLAAVERFAKTA